MTAESYKATDESEATFSRGFTPPRKPVAALGPRKVHPPTAARRKGRSAIRTPPRRQPNVERLNSADRLLRSHPFASERFHVLLNSLFKVLFNFPSRYLSTIGLVPVFSLRWSLPPT